MLGNMRRLGIFAAVVDTGSFTAAAERLGVGKAAVSKQIKRLEQDLGARLLNRSTRSLTVTDVGARVYDQTVHMLDAVREAERVARQESEAPRGQLCVASATEFGRTLCMEALVLLRRRHPDLRVRLLLEDRAIDLVGEAVDVAIRVGFFKDSSLVQKRIAATRYRLWAAPEFIARHGPFDSPEAAAAAPWVLHTRTPAMGSWVFRRGDVAHPVEVPPDILTDDTSGLLAGIVKGLGVAPTLELQAARDYAAGRLVDALPGYILDPPISVYAVMPDRRFRPARVTAYLTCLAEVISEREALVEATDGKP